jgi:hypothetical protein
MLEDHIKATLGELLFGNLALRQQVSDLQTQLAAANDKLAKASPAVPDKGVKE